MEGFVDTNGAIQEYRQVTSEYIILIDRGAVSWYSEKQGLISLSTTKSEYVATMHATKEPIWF